MQPNTDEEIRSVLLALQRDKPAYGELLGVYRDEDTGAIQYTEATRNLLTTEIIESCPYYIPRAADDGTLAKCDMCNDRVHNGLKPACVQTCPSG
ncbi:MAG: hypothetical protein P8010_21010, partial [Desulfosarcinaceae bacterium]